MKRVFIILSVLILSVLPCAANEFFENYTASNGRNIFIYHIPDEDESIQSENINDNDKPYKEEEKQDIISDDVTADTSGVSDYGEIADVQDEDYDYDDVEDMYSFVLKGYAEYNEEDANAISLDIPENEVLVLYIKSPVPVGEKYFAGLQSGPSLFDNNIYSKYSGSEYSIAPITATASQNVGGFSVGTTYSQGIDYGELEQSSGIFTKYQYKRFALSTSYAKTVNSTNNNYNDNFYIIPEVRLSQYLTLKNIFSADTVKRRKKAEVVLSVNPFGKKDYDRLRFEFGASETYDEINELLKGQFRFSTNYRF